MKKVLLAMTMMIALSAQAQIYPDGTVIQSFSATDINNNFFSSTITTNNGKHIIIDFSATWCGNCWNYHNSKVLERYYNKFGPNGTVAQDAEVLFYEADASTSSNDLNGVGTNTVGDWVMGTSYTIFNEANVTPVRSSFSNGGVMGFPTVFLVTADKRMFRIPTNIIDEDLLRDFVNEKTGSAPLSTNTIGTQNIAYKVYPNPVRDNLNIDLSLDKTNDVSYSLRNAMGQVINKVVNKKYFAGEHNISLDLGGVPAGFYTLSVQIGNEQRTQKVVIE